MYFIMYNFIIITLIRPNYLWLNKNSLNVCSCFLDVENIAIALFDYDALHDGDLGFKKGDKLKILQE